VKVTWSGNDGVLGTADDVVFNTVTDASGKYLVQNLPYGPYSVVVDTTSPKFPAGVTQTYDADGTATASTSIVSLTGVAPNNLNQDFSYTGTASLGDRIWLDQNGDGVQDPGELGIPNVGVSVTYLGADGVAGGGDDIVFTTVTDSAGNYLVNRLPAGNYTVSVNTATLPVGLSETYDLDGITVRTPRLRHSRLVRTGVTSTSATWVPARSVTRSGSTPSGTATASSTRAATSRSRAWPSLSPTSGLTGWPVAATTSSTPRPPTRTESTCHDVPLGAYTVTVVPPANLTPTFDANGIGTTDTSAVTLTWRTPSTSTRTSVQGRRLDR